MASTYDDEGGLDRLMDDLQVILGAKAGQTLTEDDVASLQRLERWWENEGEVNASVYARGYRDGLGDAGGDALVEAKERGDRQWAEAGAQKAIRMMVAADLQEVLKTMKVLVIMARTSGGTAGPDVGLKNACDAAEAIIAKRLAVPTDEAAA